MPNPVNLNTTMDAFTVFNPQLSHPEPPALDHEFATAMAKGIFAGITGNIAGVYIS